MPNLGQSDQNLVQLQPKYSPIVKRQKAQTINVQRWTDDALTQLQGALEDTDWDIFIDSAKDIDELTVCVSDYINFCSEIAAPPRQVKVYPNNKPWITAEIKQVINRNKKVFGEGNKGELKLIQKELNFVIKREKKVYKNKLESKFCQNDMKKVWDGMRLMSGLTQMLIKQVVIYQVRLLNMQTN